MAIAGILVIAVGLAILVVGFRGQRCGDGRTCRKCGYDLRGNPEAERCAECGASLGAPRAVRIGTRRVRRSAIALGLTLLIGGSLASSSRFVDYARSKFTLENAPRWYLMRSLRHDRDVSQVGSLLLDRAERGQLGPDDGSALVTAIVARQTNPTLPWSPNLSRLVDEAFDRGWLRDEATLKRFIANSVDLRPDPLVSDEAFPPLDSAIALPRVAILPGRGFSRSRIDVDTGPVRVTFPDRSALICRQPQACVTFGKAMRGGGINGADCMTLYSVVRANDAAILGPGWHRVAIRLDYVLTLRDRNWPVNSSADASPAPTGTIDFEAKAFVPPVSAPVSGVEDESFFNSIELRSNDTPPGPYVLVIQGRASFQFRCNSPSRPFAGTITLRSADGRIWPMLDLTTSPGSGHHNLVISSVADPADWKTFDADRVDIVLESSEILAKRYKIRGECIIGKRIWKDIPVVKREKFF